MNERPFSTIKGNNKISIRNPIVIYIGKPNIKIFIWGANFAKRPMDNVTIKSVPIIGRLIFNATVNMLVKTSIISFDSGPDDFTRSSTGTFV